MGHIGKECITPQCGTISRRIRTLADLIEYVQARVQRRSHLRHQESLLRRSGDAAHLFKRFVQMDQRRLIPSLHRTNRPTGLVLESTADVMADEWRSLFGTRHATAPMDRLRSLCAELFGVPAHHRLTDSDQVKLMADVTEHDVLQALRGLGTHKAAGPDRLGNDFYKDWGEALAPWLATAFTRLMRGEATPSNFAEALIVPIAKPGDPHSAMNYRSILLLQSSYKVFTKILAGRVQSSLSRVINEDQNGFVRGRAMADNINLMRAILDQASAGSTTGAVVLVDFRKAYDSIDRNFLWVAMEAFGYPAAFVQLVVRLHGDTSARFLVNGEISTEIEVTSGIRQGCPLAPLLFLIAAETLKHAVDKADGIQGVELRGTASNHTHTLSAFVNDSAIFLRHTSMIDALEMS